ncbi:unnamed protein product [Pocillopora meandrina]|uniref:G-protein coupled receptors family 1 profile domain-containing protein n=1 Tax=Pocillopora meandrina TaxID=46732 RepID=A0AAU9XT37_9CNID|nr:unnamed protein product [Pocillopora meandrina]
MTNASSLCVVLGATVQTNSTILYEHNYRNFVIGISIINGLLSPVAVVANFFILFSLWKTFSLHSVSNILVASLAMADLCVGLLLQPMLVYLMNTRLVATFCVVFEIQMFLAYLFTALSLGTLTYLSIERAVAIHWPLRYQELVTSKRVASVVIQLWVFQILISLIIWFAVGSYKTIWKIIRRHQRQIQTRQPINQEQNAFDLLKYKAKTFTSLMILKLFVLCYLPYLCVELKKLTRRGHKSIDVVEYSVLVTIVFANSSLNPLIYFWRIKDLRRAALSTLRSLIIC